MESAEFSEEQKQYLAGLARGLEVARRLPDRTSASAAHPDRAHDEARRRFESAGRTLVAEEKAKREKHPFDMWEEMLESARTGAFPKGPDVFRYKFHGLFHVAPAEDAFMCRLRLPAGVVTSHQLRGIARIATERAAGYGHVTTRANLQLRGIPAHEAPGVLTDLMDLGIVTRGSGADNVRNVTASPTAGLDPQELIDTRPLARELHHRILGRRDLYGLPRKFNVAFDGGGRVGVVADTNDVGWTAVRVRGGALPAGVYLRLLLGGVTGHGHFAEDTGVAVRPEDAGAVTVAILEAYLESGNRTDRSRARLRHLIEEIGAETFLARVRERSTRPLLPLSGADVDPRGPLDRFAHVGVHRQRQPGKSWLGVVLPVGRLDAERMRGLADVAERFGSGELRLTVWQNVLVPDVADADVPAAIGCIADLGLSCSATAIRAGLVACTGNAGCKFAASDTKRHAEDIARHVESRVRLDQPLNVHLTGCPNSCAQHAVGDIGLLGARVAAGGDDGDEVEGYHVFVGGGSDESPSLARELRRDVPATEVPAFVEALVRTYLGERADPAESFAGWIARCDDTELARLGAIADDGSAPFRDAADRDAPLHRAAGNGGRP